MKDRHRSRIHLRAASLVTLAAVVGLAAASCRSGTAPVPSVSMTGVWTLVGYSEHGVAAEAIAGTMSFDTDGTFRTDGAIRYPGEPEETLASSGTWTHDAAAGRLSLTTSDGTGLWDMAWAADTLLLTLANDPEAPPPTVLRLLR